MDLAACKALEIRGSALRPLRRIPGWGPGSLVPLPAPLKHTAPAWRALQRSLSRATSCASKRGNRPRIRAGPSRFRTASLFRRHVATRTATSERAAPTDRTYSPAAVPPAYVTTRTATVKGQPLHRTTMPRHFTRREDRMKSLISPIQRRPPVLPGPTPREDDATSTAPVSGRTAATTESRVVREARNYADPDILEPRWLRVSDTPFDAPYKATKGYGR